MTSYREALLAMDAGNLAPQDFDHQTHIAVAFEALREDDFFTASKRIADGLKRLTLAAGVPEKFHATITQAYMSAIAEAMHLGDAQDAETFLVQNPDLLAGVFLKERFSAACLSSDLARKVALLPDRVPDVA
ncbi:hypothetical protein [uncultured Shimia sp.]|uniref:hypothetical protein n=1 Tax=uncultured Shimia sp. TaxID=573152 RepID=UPI0025CFE037|nr:hypothetical protein [uncultured Shimia sp.]